MAEQLRFDVAGRDVGAGTTLRGLAKDSELAATQTRRLADAMDAQRRAAATSAGATIAAAKADKLLKDSSDEAIAGYARQRAEADKLTKSQDDTSDSAAGLAARFKALTGSAGSAGAGGLGGTGMGALITAGVALSGQLVTLGFGLGGLGLAAYGVAKPIENAAQKAGGLQKNLHLLDPEQQAVAKSLLGLQHQYGEFQDSLKPQILAAFNGGFRIAGHLMSDVQPIAQATGKALNSVLVNIDKEFQSGTWQNFFGYMANQAGPAVQEVGQNFTDLLHIMPGVLKDLTPIGNGLLKVSDGAIKAAGGVQSFYNSFQQNVPISNEHTGNALKDLDRWTVDLTNHIPGAHAVNNWLSSLQGAAPPVEKTATSIHHVDQAVSDMTRTTVTTLGPADRLGKAVSSTSFSIAEYGKNANLTVSPVDRLGKASVVTAASIGHIEVTAHATVPQLFNLDTAVTTLNTSMTTLVGNLLTLQGDDVAWRQSLQAAKKQLDSNTAGLAGNSKNALANRRAVIDSTNSAITFASQQLTLGKNIGDASKTIEAQIKWLEGLHSKSSLVRDELKALRKEEQLLAAQRINQTINVEGLGHWSISQSLAPGVGHRRAAGGLLRGPGTTTSDSIPVWASTGEYVVKAAAVSKYGAALFDSLNSMRLAGGGLVGSYQGNVAGIQPWVKRDDAATIRLIDQAVVKATVAGAKAAAASVPGFGISPSGPLQSYARKLLASYGWANQWPQFSDIVMRESGWNVYARNPSSGAYGIPQALPPGKMASAGPDWATNGFTQLRWMMSYLASRWGSPANADANEIANHWYGRGLRGGIFTRPTVIGVGDGQPERVDVTPLGRGGARSGPLVQFGDVIIKNETDEALVRQKLSLAVVMAGLS